ncbi:MAG: hypothetical protein BHV81_12585 [Butyricimonas synergistica]|nr:MAG: hypothetical protein BHV81_12585 [Butyricimonas synergistica]
MLIYDLFPYILLWILIVSFSIIKPKGNISFVVLGVILILFSGLRYGVGWDYFNYVNTVEFGGWRIDRLEYISRQIAFLAQKFHNPQLYFIINSFLTILFYFLAIKKVSVANNISFLFFFCIPIFFLTSLVTVRFSLSVAFLFYAFTCLPKRWYIYITSIFIAALMHRAAFFSILIIPFLYGFRISFKGNIVIFTICVVIGTTFSTFSLNYLTSIIDLFSSSNEFFEGVQGYLINTEGKGFSKSPLMYAVINICNFFLYRRGCTSKSDELYMTLYNIGCSLIFLFSFEPTFASRIGQYFMIYIILLAPSYRSNKLLQIIVYMVIFFSFFYQLCITGYHPDFIDRRNCFLPYQLCF